MKVRTITQYVPGTGAHAHVCVYTYVLIGMYVHVYAHYSSSAVFRNFFKGTGARLGFKKSGGASLDANLPNDLGWPFQGGGQEFGKAPLPAP